MPCTCLIQVSHSPRHRHLCAQHRQAQQLPSIYSIKLTEQCYGQNALNRDVMVCTYMCKHIYIYIMYIASDFIPISNINLHWTKIS